MSKTPDKNCRLGTVGGQAVLEGVMMRHGSRYSVAVRKENGDIVVSDNEYTPVRKKYKILNIPILRGAVNMVEMLMLSVKTLNISASLLGLDEDENDKKNKKDGESGKSGSAFLSALMVLSTILGLALGIFLFVFLPSFLTKTIDNLTGNRLGWTRNLIEGVMKIAIFIAYLSLCLLMKDIRRTFEYHGAEHKSIFCFEAGRELTPENVKEYKRFHPRCGTSFMVVIIIISIVVSSLPIFTWNNIWLRFLVKLAFLPVIVGIGFEFIMYAGKHDNIVTKILSQPGLWIQRITTREPDLKQIEVAINALKSSMPDVFPDYVHPPVSEEKIDGTEDTENTGSTESNDKRENAEYSKNAADSENTVSIENGGKRGNNVSAESTDRGSGEKSDSGTSGKNSGTKAYEEDYPLQAFRGKADEAKITEEASDKKTPENEVFSENNPDKNIPAGRILSEKVFGNTPESKPVPAEASYNNSLSEEIPGK